MTRPWVVAQVVARREVLAVGGQHDHADIVVLGGVIVVSGEGFSVGMLVAFLSFRQILADRVALLMPNGPELALAFVAVLSYCSCAPLNPAGTEAEIASQLKGVGAKAAVVLRGGDPMPARVAAALGRRRITRETLFRAGEG